MADIVKFPRKHLRPEILTAETLRHHEEGKRFYTAEMTARYCEQAVEGLTAFGIDVNDPVYEKDLAYLQTVAHGIFCRSTGMPHDIHSMVERGKKVIDEQGQVIGYKWPKVKDKTPVSIPIVANTAVMPVAVTNADEADSK